MPPKEMHRRPPEASSRQLFSLQQIWTRSNHSKVPRRYLSGGEREGFVRVGAQERGQGERGKTDGSA